MRVQNECELRLRGVLQADYYSQVSSIVSLTTVVQARLAETKL